jgi:hypothetical protein
MISFSYVCKGFRECALVHAQKRTGETQSTNHRHMHQKTMTSAALSMCEACMHTSKMLVSVQVVRIIDRSTTYNNSTTTIHHLLEGRER